MDVSLAQAMAWRRERQFLSAGASSAAEVVRRLGVVPSWSGDPDLAVRRRMAGPARDPLAAALDSGELIKTYAFRGATHLIAAEDAGAYMAVRSASRQWELKSWQEHYRLGPSDWPALRELVRDIVAQGPVRHSELVDEVASDPRFRHLRDGLAHPSHTLLKPLGWQGDLCFAPSQDGEPTFQSPASSPRWTGLPELDVAGRRAVIAYLSAYGPATRDNLHYWLAAGLSAGRRRLDGWIDNLTGEQTGDLVVEVQVDGSPMLHQREHLDPLAAAEPAPDEIDLLPGYDQWVLGPGTADHRIVSAARRQAVTRGANVVLRAGRVTGTWKADRAVLSLSWFAEAGDPPHAQVQAEAARLAGLVEHDLAVTITVS